MNLNTRAIAKKKGCERKVAYKDVANAERVLRYYRGMGLMQGLMTIYRCGFCRKYHLGHADKYAERPSNIIKEYPDGANV